MAGITFTFPMPENLGNSRMHWRKKHQRHAAWEAIALVQEPLLRGRPETLPHVRVTAVFYLGTDQRAQFMDDDNAVSRLKWCLDLLKKRGVIVDDKRPHLVLAGIPEQRKEAPRRVEVTLDSA